MTKAISENCTSWIPLLWLERKCTKMPTKDVGVSMPALSQQEKTESKKRTMAGEKNLMQSTPYLYHTSGIQMFWVWPEMHFSISPFYTVLLIKFPDWQKQISHWRKSREGLFLLWTDQGMEKTVCMANPVKGRN